MKTSSSAAASTPARAPFCDGSHNNLPGGYRTDEPDSPDNRRIATVEAGAGPIVHLDGQLLFLRDRARRADRAGHVRHCAVVSPSQGALFQSQFYAGSARGSSPVISADGRHTVLFVSDGSGRDRDRRPALCGRIAHRRLHSADRGLPHRQPWRRAARALHLERAGERDARMARSMPSDFDAEYAQRARRSILSQRHQMAERYFQLLIGREHGSPW